MGRYWTDNNFIRKDAKNLTVYAQSVYQALACHANKNGETFIGYRKIGELLNINKNTVNKAVKDLIAYGRVRRLESKFGEVSILKITTVPNEHNQPSYQAGHKDYFKEYFKEEKNNFHSSQPEHIGGLLKPRNEKALNDLKKTMERLNIKKYDKANN